MKCTTERLCIFPYDEEFAPILRHRSLLKHNITQVVSPMGWGLSNKDAGLADEGNNLNIKIESDFNYSGFDTLHICESKNYISEALITDAIEKALINKKKISISKKMSGRFRDEVSNICKEHGCVISKVNSLNREYDYKKVIFDIMTPIILIIGAGENTCKFEIQLSLRESLSNEYKISQIGSRQYCEMFGFHSFPRFMTEEVNEREKIYAFNHFIRNIEHSENPDLIIIGVPLEAIKLSNKINNGFGMLLSIVLNAVIPDITIFSCYYDDYKPVYFSNIRRKLGQMLGCSIDFINMSNQCLDWIKSEYNNDIRSFSIPSNYISEKINEKKPEIKDVYNIYDEHSKSNLVKCINYLLKGGDL